MNIIKKIEAKYFRAFTMAEVLITLGIIAVVAAITLPTLSHNSNSKKFAAQLKKTISTLSQVAVTTTAKYDFDYASIKSTSSDSSCKSDTLSAGKTTMCAMLNQTLSGATYMGVYGSAGGIFPYKINDKSTSLKFIATGDAPGFDPTGMLLYSLADGSMVGFNPSMRNCHLVRGEHISTYIFTQNVSRGGLQECIGFIDVNGPAGPNKEVRCKDGKSQFSGIPCPLPKRGISEDVFPVVFHDGKVEPATNAGRSVLMFGASNKNFKAGASGD